MTCIKILQDAGKVVWYSHLFKNFAKNRREHTREDSTHRHHQTVNTEIRFCILCSRRWRSSIQSAKTRPGADCGSDHELIAKFRLKLKKVGKTTRPFRYDLNQIPNDYTVQVTNRFKGQELIAIWTEVLNVVQEAMIKTIPKRKKCKKGQMVV